MESLFLLKSPVATALMVAFYALACAQLLCALLGAFRAPAPRSRLSAAYEFALSAHLLAGCAAANSALSGYGTAVLRLRSAAVPVEAFLWVDAAIAVAGAAVAVRCRRAAMAPEVAVVALCTPPVLGLLGGSAWLLFVADAAFFLFRTGSAVVLAVRASVRDVSPFSMAGAMNRLPEGILLADARGRIAYLNDSMRACLAGLGLPTDHADARTLWDALAEKAADGEADPRNAVLSEGLRIGVPPDEVRLFVRDTARLGRVEYQRMAAVDVTEEEELNAGIERTNRFLDAANRELAAQVRSALEVARADALLRMRSRVHDVLGQRLSILHRYLEDGADDPERLSQVVALLQSAVADLSSPSEPDYAAELQSVRGAFALIGLDMACEGELPDDVAAADAFVRIAREAVTNAAKHGRAGRVLIAFRQDGGCFVMTVENDGEPYAEGSAEGTGFPSMRQAVRGAGGTLRIVSADPFALEARVPVCKPKGEDER